MLHEIHQRALRLAAEIVGGNEKLMTHIAVSEVEFASWSGKKELPRDVFLRLVDIITVEEVRGVRSMARRNALVDG